MRVVAARQPRAENHSAGRAICSLDSSGQEGPPLCDDGAFFFDGRLEGFRRHRNGVGQTISAWLAGEVRLDHDQLGQLAALIDQLPSRELYLA